MKQNLYNQNSYHVNNCNYAGKCLLKYNKNLGGLIQTKNIIGPVHCWTDLNKDNANRNSSRGEKIFTRKVCSRKMKKEEEKDTLKGLKKLDASEVKNRKKK